jgi:nucleoside-diphosphate-sugar epimerase
MKKLPPTAAVWKAQPMRVIILGCGYVGSALGSALLARGHRVLGTTTRDEGCAALAARGIESVILQLSQRDRLRAALSACDAAVIMVAPAHSRAAYEEVYLQGVRHVLEAVCETSVRHILYTSSTSVYGQSDGSWVDEASPTQPAAQNGRILVQAERELAAGAARTGVAAAIVRLAGIVGPGRGPGNRVAQWAGRERDDPETYVNLIHRDDIVSACLALIDRQFAGTLNLSDGRPIQRREYYNRLIAAAGLHPIRWVTPAEGRNFGKRVSNRRLVALLGLEPRDAAAASVGDLSESGAGPR